MKLDEAAIQEAQNHGKLGAFGRHLEARWPSISGSWDGLGRRIRTRSSTATYHSIALQSIYITWRPKPVAFMPYKRPADCRGFDFLETLCAADSFGDAGSGSQTLAVAAWIEVQQVE